MQLTHREFWTALHGMIFGSLYLLTFTGTFVALWSLRKEWITPEGAQQRCRCLVAGSWIMVILVWLAVIAGTYIIYPWYRAKPPKDLAANALADYPKALLLSDKRTTEWHEFGMEWKEHIAWFAPILATAVAFVITKYRQQLADDPAVRRMLLALLTISFFCASVAGFFGAMINKAAPTR
jgi:hypothetical protein